MALARFAAGQLHWGILRKFYLMISFATCIDGLMSMLFARNSFSHCMSLSIEVELLKGCYLECLI